ncbi:MAG: hypothetical protein FK734_13920 [Asgard group archaeon]|nr:hypothetical protein [Asgard group archaeon]
MNSKKLSYALIIMTFASLFLLGLPTQTQDIVGLKGTKPIIIFDIAHDQRFNDTQMQSAINLIRTEFNATVYINEDSFTFTNLRGADLVILPAPYYLSEDTTETHGPFTDIEQQALVEFYEDGGSVLYLANPYFFEENMRNYSSNIGYLNFMMGGVSEEGTYGTLNLFQANGILLDDFNSEFGDERLIHVANETMATDHAIIQGFLDDEPVNDILTYATYSNSRLSESIINTSRTSYEITDEGEIRAGSVKEHSILMADELYGGRGISCASMIMFSDLEVTAGGETWFNTYDNAKLWKNIIAWLLQFTPAVAPDVPLPNYGLFAVIIIGIFFILLVVGTLLYVVGKESKKVEVSETLIEMREKEKRREKIDEEIEEAFYDAETPKEVAAIKEKEEEEEEPKEIDMKSISDEVKKKPPKTRSRSERRRR